MRFDILDEYSTLVPFALGVFKQNRVVQYPARCVGCRKLSATRRRKGQALAQGGAVVRSLISSTIKGCAVFPRVIKFWDELDTSYLGLRLLRLVSGEKPWTTR